MWLTKPTSSPFLCCHQGQGDQEGLLLLKSTTLATRSLFYTPCVRFPSLPYFFSGSVPFPTMFPAVHHNQAIQGKPYSISVLRYAFHAAEDLIGTTERQPILPVLGSSHRHRVHPLARFPRPWAQGAGLWVSEPSLDLRLHLQLF